jgi:hypothetical protein
MFTFGRENELAHVARRFGSDEKAHHLISVINAIHDLIEQKIDLQFVEAIIKESFIEGKSGIWEKTAGWLLKLNIEYPDSCNLWSQLARHASATVRFRVASFLIEMKEPLAGEIYELLRNDKSKKVSSHAEGKWDFRQHPEKYA